VAGDYGSALAGHQRLIFECRNLSESIGFCRNLSVARYRGLPYFIEESIYLNFIDEKEILIATVHQPKKYEPAQQRAGCARPVTFFSVGSSLSVLSFSLKI
jgi:hypothetical protein